MTRARAICSAYTGVPAAARRQETASGFGRTRALIDPMRSHGPGGPQFGSDPYHP